MGKIDYNAIYAKNKHDWYGMTEEPQKYEALLAGHYSDSNHFVYELLQNAEDAEAGKVVIEYYSDKLVFYHNGRPFSEADAIGVSSMLMGTKDRDDASSIGRFGMGFKSVFKYTYQPEIYSDDEAFKITKYLLPVEIIEGWNCQAEKESITCKLASGGSFTPFSVSEHLTKIVIPFMKYGRKGQLEAVPGDDVLQKLNELEGEILLFLTHIQNLYWVNRDTGKHAMITLKVEETDARLITCRIVGTDYGNKEDISRYLKYKKVFDHDEMKNAEVSVVYKVNARADNVNEVDQSNIWVYFPTRDNTDLPFLIHGSFETAVSREKLMTPSAFNSDLFDKLGDLIADSMIDLADRKLITQGFLRRVVMSAFKDESTNHTIPGLKEKVTKAIIENGLIPDRKGEYHKPSELRIPVPFRIGDFSEKPLFKTALAYVGDFVAFNNEREVNFTDYFMWLNQDLKIKIYGLQQLAIDMKRLPDEHMGKSGANSDALKDFYDFLSDNRVDVYKTSISWTRSGPYEQTIRNGIDKAWKEFRKAPIILNRLGKLVPAYVDGQPSIYLGSSSEYKSVMQSALVQTDIATQFKNVLMNEFQIHEFNNFQYIKEKVIKKYVEVGELLAFENPNDFKAEYVEDIKQILDLIEDTGNVTEIAEMLKDANIIKVTDPNGEDLFSIPGKTYLKTSDEGIDLSIYYQGVYKEETEEENEFCIDFEYDLVDEAFYEEHDIPLSKLKKLGIISSPVTEGCRREDGVGDGHWVAIGEYCPNIDIEGLEDNLYYIEEYPEEGLAQEKSVEALKLLLAIYKKLEGKRRYRKNNPYEGALEAAGVITYSVRRTNWLYNKNNEVCRPSELSRYDLNPAIYKGISGEKVAYKIIGFTEKEADNTADTFQQVGNLDKKYKMVLLKRLARELGREVVMPGSVADSWDEPEESEEVFDANSWQDTEFPKNRVKNLENLVRHVQEQFYCADPTTYKKVWRQIRTSRSPKTVRAYAMGMYTNDSDIRICQICKEPFANAEVSEIANYGIEMPQLNICTCRNCAAKYKAVRDVNKDTFKQQMRTAILSLDVDADEEEYIIEINSELVLHFTQTHIAEIQEIFRLLSEYGTPQEIDEDGEVSGPLLQPVRSSVVEQVQKDEPSAALDEDVARAGCFITYKKRFAGGEVYDNTLQPDKFPLHKAFVGHKIGDIVIFQNREYEITGIL